MSRVSPVANVAGGLGIHRHLDTRDLVQCKSRDI